MQTHMGFGGPWIWVRTMWVTMNHSWEGNPHPSLSAALPSYGIQRVHPRRIGGNEKMEGFGTWWDSSVLTHSYSRFIGGEKIVYAGDNNDSCRIRILANVTVQSQISDRWIEYYFTLLDLICNAMETKSSKWPSVLIWICRWYKSEARDGLKRDKKRDIIWSKKQRPGIYVRITRNCSGMSGLSYGTRVRCACIKPSSLTSIIRAT